VSEAVGERHRWRRTKRERRDGGPARDVRVCDQCGMVVGAELADVLRPTCAERVVRQVMDS